MPFRVQPYQTLYRIRPTAKVNSRFERFLASRLRATPTSSSVIRPNCFSIPFIARSMSTNVNMAEREDIVETPRKRLKTDNAPPTGGVSISTSSEIPTERKESTADVQADKETEVGITEFVSRDNEGFTGIFKKRYTDFLVNEILPSGEVLHLRSTSVFKTSGSETENKGDEGTDAGLQAPAAAAAAQTTEPAPEEKREPEKPAEAPPPPTEFHVSDEDNSLLESYFGPDVTQKILKLHKRAMSTPKARPGELGKATTSSAITDRELRTKMHQAIRRIFHSQLESSTDSEGAMSITAAPNRFNRNIPSGRAGNPRKGGGKINWDDLGGQFLHFTIYKENKDTMETISFIARQLKMNAKVFQFAGTKDRRGVTVQRACAYRVFADRLAKVNKSLRNATVGDFEYCQYGLDLGDLNGNEFVVTLRDCELPGIDMQQISEDSIVTKAKEIVGQSLRNLHQRGYFNYYGLQRFGTFSMRTDMVGRKMLQGDFKGACDTILHVSPHILAAALGNPEDPTVLIGMEDKARAEAIHLFRTGAAVNQVLDKLPRKFTAEVNIIRTLSRSKSDYLSALQTIPRNLRLMYVHAYQSLVWNFAVGERWRLYGDKVVEGDLVIVNEHKDKTSKDQSDAQRQQQQQEQQQQPAVDADGEVIITPQANDSSYTADDIFVRARPLTASEAASGNYTIFDIVLPLPGFDILYPPNEMTEFYKRFMANAEDGPLDPFNMRRKWKDVSLSGSYRKLVSRMGADYSFDVKMYSEDDEQFVRTDAEMLRRAGNGKDANKREDNNNNNNDESTAGEPGDDTTREDEEGEKEEKKKKLAIILKFQLGTSQYATMALRELSKGKGKGFVPDFGGK